MFPLSVLTLIAPFWDHVDIRRFGDIFYRETSNVTLLQRAHDQLQELFPFTGNFTPTTLFIATWDRVAQFGGGTQVHICMTVHWLYCHWYRASYECCGLLDCVCVLTKVNYNQTINIIIAAGKHISGCNCSRSADDICVLHIW